MNKHIWKKVGLVGALLFMAHNLTVPVYAAPPCGDVDVAPEDCDTCQEFFCFPVCSGGGGYPPCLCMGPACFCGNGTCDPGEDCTNCLGDCGACPPPPPPPTCGDGNCDIGEDCTCNDCAPCPPPPPACTPDCSCAQNICSITSCPDGCGGTCVGALPFQEVPACGDCNLSCQCAGGGFCGVDSMTGASLCQPCDNPPPPPPPPPPPLPPVPPPIPPVGACGATKHCGQVVAIENPSVKLVGIPIELRDSSGRLVHTTATDSDGRYLFDSITPGNYVMPVADRNQVSIPVSRGPLPMNGNPSDFKMRGVKAEVIIQGDPGAFVLITPGAYNISEPPPMSAAGGVEALSSAISLCGDTRVLLRAGSYHLTCWNALRCGNQVKYVKTGSVAINGGVGLIPQQTPVNASCPVAICPL